MPVTVNIHLDGLGDDYAAAIRAYRHEGPGAEAFVSIDLTPAPNTVAILAHKVAQLDHLLEAVAEARRQLITARGGLNDEALS